MKTVHFYSNSTIDLFIMGDGNDFRWSNKRTQCACNYYHHLGCLFLFNHFIIMKDGDDVYDSNDNLRNDDDDDM